ncbi:hypothetical protein AVEN_263850-1 [Araneus ventricosus]|uniref:Uncharacterized protein n=1 Tax=Araneus ventricosus TaxID=182803 RepID=A0A4Y2E2A4_ARAVE|nr:hypothetical protein AVEN_263850-1 [Araneus ventricosus]
MYSQHMGFLAAHKKQTQGRQPLKESSLAYRQKMEEIKPEAGSGWEGKTERRPDPWVPRDRDTLTHLMKVSPSRGGEEMTLSFSRALRIFIQNPTKLIQPLSFRALIGLQVEEHSGMKEGSRHREMPE